MPVERNAIFSIEVPEKSAFSLKLPLLGIGLIFFLNTIDYVYQRLFAFTKGLDYSTQQYQQYWMSVLYAELIIEALIALFVVVYLWQTRDRNLENLSPAEELKRYWIWGSFVLMYAFAVFIAAYYAEQDATWHQTVIRDTSFTPSHIIEFYQSYPVYIILGLTFLMYALTRLPQFAKATSLPLVILVASPLMIFPNVGLNEFGHTRWFMEEVFSAPLHWGFAIFAWGALSLYGVLVTVCPRVYSLIDQVYLGAEAPSASIVIENPEACINPLFCSCERNALPNK